MVEHPKTGAFTPFDFSYLYDKIPELKSLDCVLEVCGLEQPIDSSSITPSDWIEIARLIKDSYEAHDGFVVLHGTDTMSFSAAALSFMLRGLKKPVVFTGSQLPIGRLRTDGKENLLTAIEVAVAKREDGSPRVPEVTILFQDYLMRGNRTSKVSADKFRAFKSHNYPHLAFTGIDIRYNDPIIHHEEADCLEVYLDLDPNVAVLKLFPGITEPFVRAVLSTPGLKGVVLETFGSGNAPLHDWFASILRESIERGIIVVNVTQCSTGSVDMQRYETGRHLECVGLVSGYDMTTEAAVTKLMCLLGQGLDNATIRTLMQTPLRGEMTIDPDAEDYFSWAMMDRIRTKAN